MQIDKPVHRKILLEILGSQAVRVPGSMIDEYVELRDAVRGASIPESSEPSPSEETPTP